MTIELERNRYIVHWTREELDLSSLFLKVEPLLIFDGRREPDTREIQESITSISRPRQIAQEFREGLYRYYLVQNSEDGFEERLGVDRDDAWWGTKLLGNRQQLGYGCQTRNGFRVVSLISPVPLKEGMLWLDYGFSGKYPLPAAVHTGGAYVIECCLREHGYQPLLKAEETITVALDVPEIRL